MNDAIHHTLNNFAEAQAGARRFHADALGKGVNPDHSFGDWLRLVMARDDGKLEKKYGSVRTKTALSESAGGTSGGYLVPQELRLDLARAVASKSIFRPSALVVPMTSATLELLLPDATTVQASGVPPYFGGLNLKWTAENITTGGTNISETEPAWRQDELKAKNLTGYALASQPMLDDAGGGFEAVLYRLIGDAVVWFEDQAFFSGLGLAAPLGIIPANGSIKVTRGTPNKFLAADAQSMVDNLLPESWERACWAMHPTVTAQVTAFTGWIPNGPMMLHGRPIVVTGRLPTLGTTGDVCLIDPGLYVIGDRQAVEIAYSREFKFTNNQGTFLITERVDGMPFLNAPVTLPDTTSTVSPFVVLQ